MRITGSTSSAANLALALRLAEAVAANRCMCPSGAHPAPARRDYAEFLASNAADREVERPAYADLLRARGEASRAAQRAATAQVHAPLAALVDTTRPALCATKNVQERRPADPPRTPWAADSDLATRRAAFRAAVQTIDNRGSLIDLLL